MNCDAIILARGGSKGIPGKNIIEVAGKPLIAWTIEMAVSSEHIRDAVVSTDAPEIAEIAEQCGARVVGLRPAALSGDLASSEGALLHAINHFCRTPLPDIFLFPQVTSPVRSPGLIDRALLEFARLGCDSMFSSAQIKNFIWRGGASLQPMYDTMERPMRQHLRDEDVFFRETGNFYIARTAGFLASECRTFGTVAMFETSENETIEIDEPEDLAVAEAALAAMAHLA